MSKQSVIAIIPARGGSKGIPRKNLRPVNGKPLIFYAIDACIQSKVVDKVVVSTDDDEIALLSERFGAEVHFRDPNLADDQSTLDPVIFEAVEQWELKHSCQFDWVLTVQPTSPLIRAVDIKNAITLFSKEETANSLISVVDDRHLTWTVDGDKKAMPLYKERVNRQFLPLTYKETGAILLCTRAQLATGQRLGANVVLFEMEPERSFDIDSVSDLLLCESILNQKKIVFVVAGYAEIGLGHAFRSVMIAGDLVRHQIVFLLEEKSEMAANYIREHNYPVQVVPDGNLLNQLEDMSPDLIVNDVLDTEFDFIKMQKSFGAKVVTFEDLGSGVKNADLVFNALYSSKVPMNHVYHGEQFFCLRDEFLHIERKELSKEVSNILISFGGVDPANQTLRVLEVIEPIVSKFELTVNVVIGPGYEHVDKLVKWVSNKNIKLIQKTKRISDWMNAADIVFTSGGRTVYEVASLRKPMCVICQNTRELMHSFASAENGVMNLGLHSDVKNEDIRSAFEELVFNFDLRHTMYERLSRHGLENGKQTVVHMIEDLMKR